MSELAQYPRDVVCGMDRTYRLADNGINSSFVLQGLEVGVYEFILAKQPSCCTHIGLML